MTNLQNLFPERASPPGWSEESYEVGLLRQAEAELLTVFRNDENLDTKEKALAAIAAKPRLKKDTALLAYVAHSLYPGEFAHVGEALKQYFTLGIEIG